MFLTASQCRMARVGLKLSQEELAGAAGVLQATVSTFEIGANSPRKATQRCLRWALETHGAEFLDGNGVRVP